MSGLGFPVKTSESTDACSSLSDVGETASARPERRSAFAGIELAPAPPSAGEQGCRPITQGAVDAGEAAGLASGEYEDCAPARGREPLSFWRVHQDYEVVAGCVPEGAVSEPAWFCPATLLLLPRSDSAAAHGRAQDRVVPDVLSCTVRAAEAVACQTGAAAEDAYAAPLAAASDWGLCIPRKAGLSLGASRDPHPDFAGLRTRPPTAGGLFPAFTKTRYSRRTAATSDESMSPGASLAVALVPDDPRCQLLRAVDVPTRSSSVAGARRSLGSAPAMYLVRSARVERFSFWKTCVRCVSTVRRVT